MAFADTEIEVKLEISEDQYRRLEIKLPSLGKKTEEAPHRDAYFSPHSAPYVNERYPFEWLSIRERGDRAFINYKHFFPEGAEHHTHATEINLPIEDPDRFASLLLAIGFEELVVVAKLRLAYLVDDLYEVSLDRVDGLGHFVEIEAMKDQGGIAKTRERLETLAADLDLGEAKADPRGYPYQLLRQAGRVS